MKLLERLHERFVKSRRVAALASRIAPHLPPNSVVLDVGCGDGRVAEEILRRRPDLRFCGIDVMVRETSRIPVTLYDGESLPFAEGAFDVVLFVDVLHHTPHAEALLESACRVARGLVLIKDHCAEGLFARPTLRFMDRVGNARFGVAVPYLYLSWEEWRRMLRRVGMGIVVVQRRLALYPPPFTWVFDRSLHFLAVMQRTVASGVGGP